MKFLKQAISTLLVSCLSFSSCVALADDSLSIATWNVAFIDRSVGDLDLEGFKNEVDFDILIVNEVKKSSDLDSLIDAMELEPSGFSTAISSFDQGDGGLEVGVISRFPIGDVVEYDRSLDGSGDVEEKRLERVEVRGIADVGVGRGFLVVEIPAKKLYVIATHLKSSRGRSGDSDHSNAQKRELVAAAISEEAKRLIEANPEYTVVLGGDVNVGVSDTGKNGTILEEDRTDGYDDTHAILELGLINGFEMKSLAKNVSETFVGRRFPGTGAIDVLYVAGALEDNFEMAQATSESFGSDHLAVFASTGDGDDGNNGGGGEQIPGIEITNALPNPVGEDSGREQVTINNGEGSTIDISGWTLRDRANNTYIFPDDTFLVEGENNFTLPADSVPLNNDGDSIELLNSNGDLVGDIFTYSRSDVRVGFPVR